MENGSNQWFLSTFQSWCHKSPQWESIPPSAAEGHWLLLLKVRHGQTSVGFLSWGYRSLDHGKVCVERDLKDNVIPFPLPWDIRRLWARDQRWHQDVELSA